MGRTPSKLRVNQRAPVHGFGRKVWRETMMLRRLFATVGLVVAILAGAAMASAGGGQGTADDNQKLGFSMANMDTTCKPCDDFYKYVNGGWMKKNPIPAQYPA